MKWHHLPICILVSLIILIFCPQTNAEQNNKTSPSSLPGFRAVETFQIGVASMITPVDSLKYYMEIIDYIGEKLGRPIRMIQRRTYDEMDILLEKGEVQVAFVCSASYVRDKEQFGAELLVAPQVNGNRFYQSYIIVHKDSPIKSLEELKGRNFAFVDPKSNTGMLAPMFMLLDMGYNPKSFFAKYIFTYSHNKSIEMVAKKIVDGASVESLIYDFTLKKDSRYTKMTRIIDKSPFYGIPPVIATKDLEKSLKAKLQEIFLDMHNDPRGKAILEAMMIDKFFIPRDEDYNSIREIDRQLNLQSKFILNKPRKEIVRFSVVPRYNPRLSYQKYQPLLDYLSETTPYEYELILRKTYEDTVVDLGNGLTDLALLGPLTYLEAHARYGVKSILKPLNAGGRPDHKSYIIVKKDSPIKDITDLRSKIFAFASYRSTSGNLLPRVILAENGIHLSELLGYKNYDYHDSVVKAVLRGDADAGSVRDSIEERYELKGLKVLAVSGSIPNGPLTAAPGTSDKLIQSVKQALLRHSPGSSDKEPALGRLDEELKYGFIEARDEDYEGVRRIINAVPKTCGKGCHPNITF